MKRRSFLRISLLAAATPSLVASVKISDTDEAGIADLHAAMAIGKGALMSAGELDAFVVAGEQQ